MRDRPVFDFGGWCRVILQRRGMIVLQVGACSEWQSVAARGVFVVLCQIDTWPDAACALRHM